ncbi:MAG: phosphoribosylformylglycinamidine cyclo-ligase [Deltaproteobacteria bacterium]|nr:phosphoribosylformylglycinamidine cyclo-ligase [Deltaproteobacteria bacterium]
MGLTYKDAGVDIEAGDELVEMIRPAIERTRRPECIGGIGGFGGLFKIDLARYREPVLVSGTDGVGTKLKVAFAANRHDTVGYDLVAMSVNDVLVTGAEPVFFLDYFATGRLEKDLAAKVIVGIADACVEAGCALIGGETAELPGFYADGEYDLAGFAVGVVERSNIIDGGTIAPGDQVIGLASSGLHSNGYSLARRALLGEMKLKLDDAFPGSDRTVGDVLLTPTRIYAKPVLAVMRNVTPKGLAHITGSGLPGNVPRGLPDGTKVVLHQSRWEVPQVFRVMEEGAGISRDEMYRTFNMGVGMAVIVGAGDVDKALAGFAGQRLVAWHIGEVAASGGEPTVEINWS